MKHRSDPVYEATEEPLRIAWDGLKLHAHPQVTVEELQGVIARLQRLCVALNNAKGGLVVPDRPRFIHGDL